MYCCEPSFLGLQALTVESKEPDTKRPESTGYLCSCQSPDKHEHMMENTEEP